MKDNECNTFKNECPNCGVNLSQNDKTIWSKIKRYKETWTEQYPPYFDDGDTLTEKYIQKMKLYFESNYNYPAELVEEWLTEYEYSISELINMNYELDEEFIYYLLVDDVQEYFIRDTNNFNDWIEENKFTYILLAEEISDQEFSSNETYQGEVFDLAKKIFDYFKEIKFDDFKLIKKVLEYYKEKLFNTQNDYNSNGLLISTEDIEHFIMDFNNFTA